MPKPTIQRFVRWMTGWLLRPGPGMGPTNLPTALRANTKDKTERSDSTPPRNVTAVGGRRSAVGGIVVENQGVLLVRMTYGPIKGRYMFPGGIVDPGETLDEAVVREVREETGVETHVIVPCAIRTRYDGPNNDTYVMFLLEPVGGTPRSDGS